MSGAVTASPLVDAPPPLARRPRVLFIGAALGAAASALVVLTMLAAYLQVRSDNLAVGLPTLPEGTVLPLTPGHMAMTTFLMSAVTVAWAVYALRNGDRSHAYVALGLTLLLGAANIVETVYLYQQLALPTTSTPMGTLLYATTGAHLVMMIAGLVFIAVMAFQALGGQLSGRDAEGMTAAALYWYVVIAVYTAIWYGIYITK
ncbi:MAG: cytochrome c oxidase subunit 3 [Actinomycetota bacterium]|jgi:cytochrome c oxidase subunit 3|nr:cytochrome c oxidase subunit 3 [Actinomycetota bacterium]